MRSDLLLVEHQMIQTGAYLRLCCFDQRHGSERLHSCQLSGPSQVRAGSLHQVFARTEILSLCVELFHR